MAFLAGNLAKAASDRWLPLGIESVVFVVMATWWVGQRRIQTGQRRGEIPLRESQKVLTSTKGVLHRVPRNGVFIARNSTIVPIALISMVNQNSALHKRAILLSHATVDVPIVTGSVPCDRPTGARSARRDRALPGQNHGAWMRDSTLTRQGQPVRAVNCVVVSRSSLRQ